jgi:SAM-dependent methyltransferase/signal transduction histidine kinase
VETPAETADRLLHASSFGAVAAAYAQYRPTYADAAILWCLEPPATGPVTAADSPLSPDGNALRVADLGAGTGIVTAALVRLGADVTAIEPDPDMLAELRRRLPQVRAEDGTAEAIPLPDASVDAVLVGQALHWFDLDLALPEIARVLVPGGTLAALWNVDDDRVRWVAELAEMSRRQGANTLLRWREGYARSWQEAALRTGGELFQAAEFGEFANPQQRTAESITATLATHSHLLVLPEAERAALLAQVSDFLHEQPETAHREFTLPLVTVAVRARRRSPDVQVLAVPLPRSLSHTGPVEPAANPVGGQIQSTAGRGGRARRPPLRGPSDQALDRLAGWYAIALRLGGAVLFTAIAVLAATKQVSGWWLGTLLAALCLWSAFFTWRIRRTGLTPIVVLADAVVISVLALAQQHLVPGVLIEQSTTWMLPLACTSVYILQIAVRPWLGLPGAAIVVVAYGLGAGHLTDAWLLVVETIVAAGLVAVIRGGARQADSVVAAGLETERQIRAEQARRADEREQHRQLHDTVLSTLTMVAAGAFAESSPALTAQADRDLRVLQGLDGAPAVPGELAPLTDLRPKLEQAAASTDDLAVRLKLVPATLPTPVVDQLVACVGEALRNAEQHAGTGQAEVTVNGGAGWAIIKITDHGRGFDTAATPPSRRGIRESITGRMLAVGGRAAIASRPGAGTIVTVSWPA